MNRGIIGSPNVMSRVGTSGFNHERGISPEELRYYALYWDRVVIPSNNIIQVGLVDEEIYLGCGLIERPLVEFKLSGLIDVAGAIVESQMRMAQSLILSDTDVDWVIHQVGTKLVVPEKYSDVKKSLRFDLINLLPVPIESVEIPDILEFKHRRADELNSLHDMIDSIYMDVLKSPDIELSKRKSVSELKKSIQAIEVVTEERWKKTKKFDYSVNFNLEGGKLAGGLAAGATFDFFSSGMSVPIGTIIGSIGSILSVKASSSVSFQPSENKERLSYLSQAHKEGII